MRSKPKLTPVMPEAPVDSIVNKVPAYTDPLEGIDEMDLATVHIVEVDRRLALMGRFVLEAALRSKGQMSLKDKADIAIRTINVVEGAKQRVELWARDEAREVPRTVEQYERERQEAEGRLRMLLERKSTLAAPKKDAIEAALQVVGEGEN